MMPGMSGYEVCRKLREMYPLSCIPVIMISAKSKEEHIVEGLAAGSNDYVVKPFGRQVCPRYPHMSRPRPSLPPSLDAPEEPALTRRDAMALCTHAQHLFATALPVYPLSLPTFPPCTTRQEILARIAAHLRFRDTVYHAGEIAGAIPGEMLPSRVLLRGGSGGALDLAPFLTGPARFSSLPLGILQGIKAGTISTTMQVRAGLQAEVAPVLGAGPGLAEGTAGMYRCIGCPGRRGARGLLGPAAHGYLRDISSVTGKNAL